MAESHVITGLVSKHCELVSEAAHLRKEIARIDKEVKSIDVVIKLLDPNYNLSGLRTNHGAQKIDPVWYCHLNPTQNRADVAQAFQHPPTFMPGSVSMIGTAPPA